MNKILVLKQDPILGSQYMLINEPPRKRIPVKNFTAQAQKVAKAFEDIGSSTEELIERFTALNQESIRLSTGLKELDELINGGLSKGKVIIVGASPVSSRNFYKELYDKASKENIPPLTMNTWAQSPEREPWFQGFPSSKELKEEYLNFPNLEEEEPTKNINNGK